MPFWNEKRVQEFVSGLGEGVQGATLEEFLGFIAGLFLVIFVIVWLQRRSDSFKKKKAWEHSRELFERELEERMLPPSAIQLMEDLAHAMENADRGFEIHRLFREPSIFDRYANWLIEDDADLRRPLRLLKPILGLGHGFSGQSVLSTEEIPAGQWITLILKDTWTARAQVLANDAKSLRVQCQDLSQSDINSTISSVTIQWERKGILHESKCRIKTESHHTRSATTPAILHLQHSDEVKKLHRRKFIRASCDLAGTLQGKRIRIRNIGGGGFMSTDADVSDLDTLSEGPSVLVCKIDLVGRIIECSVRYLESSALGQHFAFERIRPGDQDRIVHFVLEQSQIDSEH